MIYLIRFIIAPTALCALSVGAFGQSIAALETKISPISMSANSPGFEVTQRTLDRWVAQTDLSYKQLDTLGIRTGVLDEAAVRRLLDSEVEFRARGFVDFVDNVLRGERGSLSRVNNDNLTIPWSTLNSIEPFLRDAVQFGGFDTKQETRFREAITSAALLPKEGGNFESAAIATKMILDARQGASRLARGYRQLVDLIRKELEGREASASVVFVFEVSTSTRQPTLAPIVQVTLRCGPSDPIVLVFDQKKRECNDSGICKVEATASVSKGSGYRSVYDSLKSDGRKYLDKCTLDTIVFVDGVEIIRPLPGRFTSITGQK